MAAAKEAYFNVTPTQFMKSNPAKFWRSILPRDDTPCNFIIQDKCVIDPSDILNSFNDYFWSVYTLDNGCEPSFCPIISCPPLTDSQINDSGVHNLLLNLDCKNRSGPDVIPNSFLHCYSVWMSRYLNIIFQKSVHL